MSDRPRPISVQPTVQQVGEQGLLQLLQSFCPSEVIGDDAAVLTPTPGQQWVVTTDVLVEGVHFSDRTMPAAAVGWRAAAVNLSDLAAMGATPLGITVGLGLPGDRPLAWVEGIYHGLTECLQRYGAVILGGDVVRSPVTTLSITAFGEVTPAQVIRRSTAQPGQAIVVTGVHGASRAGLELLLQPDCGGELTQADRDRLIQAHQRPHPRLDVLPILARLRSPDTLPPNQPANAIAGMDSSDGLADAVVQLCRASGVGARLIRQHIPMPAAFEQWLTPQQAWNWVLYGGEDFELVLCLWPEIALTLVHEIGQDAAIIGTTTVEPGVLLVDAEAPFVEETLTLEQGFQHFSQAAPLE